MLDIDNDPRIQIHLLQIIAQFVDPKNTRKRVKKSSFKILNAIYLLTKNNENKGRSSHFPKLETIAKAAKIKSRRIVAEFINSPEMEMFCGVKRNKFTSHEYFLKDWVYQWFRLFWRFGMMKYFHTNYKYWNSDFQKRMKNWLLPLVEKGIGIKQIYETVLNKLPTANPVKVNTANPVKVNTIKPPGGPMKPSGSKTNSGSFRINAIQDMDQAAEELSSVFSIRDGDINWLINNLSLKDIRGGIRIRTSMLGYNPGSPIKGFMDCVNRYKKGKNGRTYAI